MPGEATERAETRRKKCKKLNPRKTKLTVLHVLDDIETLPGCPRPHAHMIFLPSAGRQRVNTGGMAEPFVFRHCNEAPKVQYHLKFKYCFSTFLTEGRRSDMRHHEAGIEATIISKESRKLAVSCRDTENANYLK